MEISESLSIKGKTNSSSLKKNPMKSNPQNTNSTIAERVSQRYGLCNKLSFLFAGVDEDVLLVVSPR